MSCFLTISDHPAFKASRVTGDIGDVQSLHLSRTRLSIFSVFSLSNAEHAGFSLAPADNLAPQMPSTCEHRGGRFLVNCPGNRKILAVLLEMFAVDCSFFHAE